MSMRSIRWILEHASGEVRMGRFDPSLISEFNSPKILQSKRTAFPAGESPPEEGRRTELVVLFKYLGFSAMNSNCFCMNVLYYLD